ncbi:hypothetical protein BjapCC829_22895 [Bradyrhizobium barranii]|uniref:Uncharacterized protein n=1 Tax=Bradyrhizobium barranii TaxID=2992140 RepID=A0ABY3QAF7_9BRAD|nr:hypothetical protein [Bradyrhizobium japonicum]UFW82840.1 hypothetical protein BjapCC829_22895 [Bradyrhizobium japonicum]
MTALYNYSTGTVSVASGGTTVTGTTVIWTDGNVKPGDILQIGNYQTIITDVTDFTHLVIPPWGGGAQTSVAYKIWQVSPQRFAGAGAMQDVGKLVGALNTSGFFVFVNINQTVPDPSLGDDGQYAFQPTTGKTWAKVGGVWSYLGVNKAFNLRGAYDNAATYSYGDVQTTSGSSYIYINETPSAGHAAPNVTYWQLLASIGATGNTGPTGAGYGGTSTTSLAIGTGSKVFTTQAGLAYTNGARVRATATAGATGWLEGVVTYSGTTLTITSDKVSGSGTGTAWTFNVAGQPGAGDVVAANNGTEFTASTFATNLGLVRGSVGHIPGDTTGSAPTTGEIGQRIQTILAGTLSTTNTAVNCGSITLTPGNWDVSAAVIFNAASGATTGTDWWDILSTVSTPSTAAGNAIDGATYHDRLASVADHSGVHTHAPWRMTVTVNTVVYCHAMATFSAGTGYGVSGTLGAVRAS